MNSGGSSELRILTVRLSAQRSQTHLPVSTDAALGWVRRPPESQHGQDLGLAPRNMRPGSSSALLTVLTAAPDKGPDVDPDKALCSFTKEQSEEGDPSEVV